MITEQEVEKAAEFIRDNAKVIAESKGNRIYLEQFRKSQKALLMNECEEDKISAKEMYAYSHVEYLANIEALGDAVQEEERLRWLMVAAQVKIEIWRSQQATNRTTDNSHR